MTAITVNQNAWGHIKVTGPDRVRFLNGMVTSNIKTLEEGGWLRTILLNHKARVLSIFDVHAHGEFLLLSCPASLSTKTMEILDRHIVMDDVELASYQTPMHTVWKSAADVWEARPVFAEAQSYSWDAEVECLRIEAGMPRYGVDVSEENFPFESKLIDLIDYEKGCFAGQEPVSRVHHRGGGGSKRLLGLRISGDHLPEVGATISTAEKTKGGVVTSVANSPRLGAIALASVHKSAWEPGSPVQIGNLNAIVCGLPFQP